MTPDENFTSDVARRTLAAALDVAQASGRNVGRGRASRPRSTGDHFTGDPAAPGQPSDLAPNRDRASRGHRGTGSASTRCYRRHNWPGTGPDKWDPQLLSALIADTVKELGWETELTSGRIINNWPNIVGEEIASHSHVEKLDDEGTLHIRTDTTAWATQLRLLQPQILAELGKRYGSTVRMLRILGPNRPSWRKGPKHVKGKGPRDTYG